MQKKSFQEVNEELLRELDLALIDLPMMGEADLRKLCTRLIGYSKQQIKIEMGVQ